MASMATLPYSHEELHGSGLGLFSIGHLGAIEGGTSSFGAILNKDRVTQRVPVDVPLNSEILDAVESRAAIVAAHDYVVLHVRLGHCANHMVVDGAASEHEGLAHVGGAQCCRRVLQWTRRPG